MDRTTILLAVGIALSVLLILNIMVGCYCKQTVENFKTDESAHPKEEALDLSSLTTPEKELFTKLKDNSISDKEIDKLIGSGALTSDLMEKFLNVLEVQGNKTTIIDKVL